MPQPVDVALSRSRGELTLEWEDGTVTTLPIAYLRGWCPCAGCQGHGTVVQFHEADPAIGIEGMAEAGAYGLHLKFTDGHDTGIYTWTWLRRLGPDTPPQGYKRGRFVADRFEG